MFVLLGHFVLAAALVAAYLSVTQDGKFYTHTTCNITCFNHGKVCNVEGSVPVKCFTTIKAIISAGTNETGVTLYGSKIDLCGKSCGCYFESSDFSTVVLIESIGRRQWS